MTIYTCPWSYRAGKTLIDILKKDKRSSMNIVWRLKYVCRNNIFVSKTLESKPLFLHIRIFFISSLQKHSLIVGMSFQSALAISWESVTIIHDICHCSHIKLEHKSSLCGALVEGWRYLCTCTRALHLGNHYNNFSNQWLCLWP